MSAMLGAIWSLKKRVLIGKEMMNLFDARDRGLVEINKDHLWGYYSYRVISTGEVVSFYRFLNPRDWSGWYREAMAKRPEVTHITDAPSNQHNKEEAQ